MTEAEWNQYHAAANRTVYQLYKDWSSSDEARAARFKTWDYDGEMSKFAVVKQQLEDCQNRPVPTPAPVPTPDPTPAPSPAPQLSIWQQIINFFTGKK